MFGEPPYNHLFEIFIRQVIYLHFFSSLTPWGFFLVLHLRDRLFYFHLLWLAVIVNMN